MPLNAPAPPDAAAGEHMAKLVGCRAGCHGIRGEGGSDRIEGMHRNTAPTLSDVVARYSDAELVRLVRDGVKRDGREIPGMSWMAGVDFTEQGIADLHAFLRASHGLPPGG